MVEWKEEIIALIDLHDVKEANPVELAEYAVASNIDNGPTFDGWTPYMLKK